MEFKPIVYEYKTRLNWTGEKKATLSSEGKPDIFGACPPEFGGHEKIWTPEDMFVASVELCTMSTFLWLAGKQKIPIKSYKSEAIGKASMADGKMKYVSLEVKPEVMVFEEKDIARAEKALGDIERWCLITNSISTKVDIEPSVKCVI
ncbi:MAG: OsmC family protein [Thermoplasmata archaeon]|nr:OsmC family protein [Thermoplasmata archaeon]